MTFRARFVLRLAAGAAALVLAAGVAAPYLNADRYGERLRLSLERAMGGHRRVELGKVHFSLFKGPGFTVDSVTIYEDPAIGSEPIVYIQASQGSLEVAPRLWSLLGGRFVVASINLDGASINLSKSGPAAEWGRWNFASFVDRSIMSSAPAIHVRDSRINFKFGEVKSVFYLTNTDLDVAPPTSARGGWSIDGSAQPARTDRPKQGLGSFTLQGRWYVAPERVDLDLELNRSGLGEITALMRGQTGAVHGTLSARLHLAGPIDSIGITGRLNVEDVHRWDLLPAQGQGWPLDVRGRLDLVGQQLDLQSTSARDVPLPLSVRFQAADYLSQPRWSLAVDWNQFPVEPLMDLARHMGAQIPSRLRLSGAMDGALQYAQGGQMQGQLSFHGAALTIPDSPPVAFEQAYLMVDGPHARLSPALVRTADGEEARLEGEYDASAQTLDLAISSDAMQVASLRAQVALAAVPWLEQLKAGRWSGMLRYHLGPDGAGWTGQLDLTNAEIDVPGLADPVRLSSARARIDNARVSIDRVAGSAGKLAFIGDYRYEPGASRPHRLRLRAATADAADLEHELMPTLRRAGLLARALGRSSVPDWLKDRGVDGTIQIDDLALAGAHWRNCRTRMLWDASRIEFDDLRANLGRAAFAGRLSVNLRGVRPSYRLTAGVHGLKWQDGTVNAEGTAETSGVGAQLLANLTSKGAFSAEGVNFGGGEPTPAATGSYSLEWWDAAPRLSLSRLNLRTEEETFTGRGSTQEDGHLVVLLSSGAREMRMTGTLSHLKVEAQSP